MKQAILYLRLNSVEQSKVKELFQKQYNLAEKYCTENRIEIIGVFNEKSFKKSLSERYYLNKALKVAKQLSGELNYFIVMSHSRISRSYSEFKKIREELNHSGIDILPILEDNFFCLEEYFDK